MEEIETYWSIDDLQDYHEAKDYIEDILTVQNDITTKKYSK